MRYPESDDTALQAVAKMTDEMVVVARLPAYATVYAAVYAAVLATPHDGPVQAMDAAERALASFRKAVAP